MITLTQIPAKTSTKTLTKKISAAFMLLMFVAAAATAQIKPGAKLPGFSLPDVNGGTRALSSITGKKGIVIVFTSTVCPVTNAYNSRLIKLAAYAKQNGIEFMAINSNSTEDVAEIVAHSKSKGLNFSVLKDSDGKVAASFGASVTPEVYFADGDFTLLYQGRIDDNQREDKVSRKDLEVAMQEHLGGKAVSVKSEAARGVPIKRM